VVDVGGDDGAAGGYFRTDEFGSDPLGQVGPEGLAAVPAHELLVARVRPQLVELHVLADGDVFHLRGNHALARIVQLGDADTHSGPARGAARLETQMGEGGVIPVPAAELGAGACQRLGISPLVDPGGAHIRQPGKQVDMGGRVRVGTGGIIEVDRRVFLDSPLGVGRGLGHFTHGYADVGARAFRVDFARGGKGLDNLVQAVRGLTGECFGDGAHSAYDFLLSITSCFGNVDWAKSPRTAACPTQAPSPRLG